MRWKKRGVIWKPPGTQPWARTHAMLPTPTLIADDTIRIFVNCQDAEGRATPTFVDVSSNDPAVVLRESESSLLPLGEAGRFDDSGVTVTSVVKADGNLLYMYYVGFEILTTVRYRMLTGLAVSSDGGESFSRYQSTPILERSPAESLFRCGTFVRHDEGKFKMWYVAGSNWEIVRGKAMPVYDLRYQESADGINWGGEGQLLIELEGDEHGFGRPWVIRCPDTGLYRLFYSIRRRSLAAYRLGYAESDDGVDWIRKDAQMGLDVSAGEFDSDAIMYSSVLAAQGKTYCFYNGNQFGLDGIGLAELIDD